MYYTEFTKGIKKANIVESVRSYRQLIEMTDEDKVLCVEEISEDEFLSMYSDITRNGINMN